METENPKPQTGGLKLMTVFIAVLALHVLVIGGISAYHIFKRGAGSDMSQKDQSTESTETVKPEAVTDQPLQADTNAPAPTATDAQVSDANAMAPVTDDVAHASNAAPAPTASVPPMAPATQVVPQAPAQEVKAPVAADTGVKTSMQEVTVKAGDSLYKIARQNHMTVDGLRKLNGLSSDSLKIGQKLKVEVKGAAPSAPAPTPTAVVSTVKSAPAKASAGNATYTVSKGDTLTKIAKQFKTTPAAIMSANSITDPHKLSIGAKLKIPVQQASSQAETAAPEKAASAKPQPAPIVSSDLVMVR